MVSRGQGVSTIVGAAGTNFQRLGSGVSFTINKLIGGGEVVDKVGVGSETYNAAGATNIPVVRVPVFFTKVKKLEL